MEGLRTAVPLEDAGEVVLLLDGKGVITRASRDTRVRPNILEKLGVHSKLAAVVRANALGVLDA